MQVFLIFLFSILAAALQIVLMPRLAILGVTPNLMMGLILALAIWHSEQKKEALVVLPIIFFDLLAGRPFGVMALSLWLTLFFIEWLASVLFKQNNFPAIILLALIGTIFFESCRLLLVSLFSIWRLSDPMSLTAFYFYSILPINFLYNGILSLFFIWCLNKINLFKNDRPIFKFK